MTKVTQISFDEDGGPGRRRIHLREISGDSDMPLETVGQDLRAARLRRGDDLATVSRSLKIRKDHLEAVEEDNLAALPGKTYAIGFVRSYSGYLGLDPVATVERYKQEISGRQDESPPADSSLHDDDSRLLPSGWRIAAGVVGLALIYGVWHLVSAAPAPQPVPDAPSLISPKPQVIAAAPPAPTPIAPAATADTAVPPPAINAAPPAAASQAAPVPSLPVPTARDAARSAGGLMSSGDVAAAPTQGRAQATPAVPAVPQAGASKGQVYGRLNNNSRVTLRLRSETRLTVRGPDGTLYLNRDLKPGDSYKVPDLPGLWFATSDAGAVDVLVDGTEKGRAGQNQQILGHVSLDPQSLADRFNSH